MGLNPKSIPFLWFHLSMTLSFLRLQKWDKAVASMGNLTLIDLSLDQQGTFILPGVEESDLVYSNHDYTCPFSFTKKIKYGLSWLSYLGSISLSGYALHNIESCQAKDTNSGGYCYSRCSLPNQSLTTAPQEVMFK